uniref:Uncharacterized protein n=1 Tax=Photinus pyralis TaxID=7054 RepID=A0A1Y1MC57_PHOPY
MSVKGVPVKIITGAHWKNLPEVIAYSATIPFTYQTEWNLRSTQTESPRHTACNTSEHLCEVGNQIASLEKLLDKDLNMFAKTLEPELWGDFMVKKARINPTARARRGLDFIGDFFSFCCGIATERKVDSLQSEHQKILEYLDHVHSGLNKNIRDITINSKNFAKYHEEINGNLAEIRNKISVLTTYSNSIKSTLEQVNRSHEGEIYKIFQYLYGNLFKLTKLVRLIETSEVLTSCKEHRIPSSIVHPSILRNDLILLDSELSKDNHTLSLSVNELSRYYKLQICDCTFTDQQLIVHIKIPIGRLNLNWKIYELITTPFAWNNNTCVLMHDPLYLAVALQADRSHIIKPISGVSLHHCKPYNDKLCFLPRYNSDSTYGPQCAFKMFTGATVQELEEHCSFRCHSSNSMIISEITDNSFVITHPEYPTVIKCNGREELLPSYVYNQPGALQIELPCSCAVNVNDQEVIGTRFPCATSDHSTYKAVHILPAIWSNLKTYVIKSNQHDTLFYNITECLNPNWTTTVPHLNLTTTSKLSTIVESVEDAVHTTVDSLYSYQGDTKYFIWNSILTMLVLLIGYKVWRRNAIPLAIVPSVQSVAGLTRQEQHAIEEILAYFMAAVLTLFILTILICVLIKLRQGIRRRNRFRNLQRPPWLTAIPEEYPNQARVEDIRMETLSESRETVRTPTGGKSHFYVDHQLASSSQSIPGRSLRAAQPQWE